MIVDTNALSAIADGAPAVAQVLRRQAAVYVPVVVIGEFRYGIAFSRHHDDYEAWLKEWLANCEALPLTVGIASAYAALRIGLKRNGTPIPANDAWIAALALEHGLPVLSRDTHFDHVEGVKRVDW